MMRVTAATQKPPARATPPSKPTGGRGPFWIALVIVLAGSAWFFRDEMAALAGHRRAGKAPSLRPSATPSLATPTPVVTHAPTTPAPAEPGPVARASPTLAPDPLAWLLGHKERWPEEVTLVKAADFPAVIQGKVFGTVKAPAGTEVQLVDVTQEAASVVYMGGGARVSLDAMNLRDLALVEMNLQELSVSVSPTALSGPRPIRRETVAPRPARKPGPFVHPGALHTRADFERMAAKVRAKEQPWFANWQMLESSPHNLRFPIRPVVQVIRGVPGNNYTQAQKDAATLYQCALRYQISHDKAQAEKAIELLNRWSSTMKKGVGGNSNFALGAGIVGYEFACGAEMMRDYPGWKPADFAACKEFMKLFLGSNRYYLRQHNGTGGTHYRLNWDTCNMTSMLAIGVFLDDEATFNEALDYFFDGVGNGCVERAVNYVFPNGLGQTEEMGRDQPHNTTGWAFMAQFCQIAWNQGVDLFGYENNRLLRGWEYVAKYNLGHEDVPFVPHRTCDQKYTETVVAKGAALPPMWELVYNHYANRRGIAAPYVKEAAEKLRPEGGPNPGGHPSGYDFLGFGTLAYALDAPKEDAPPSGLRGFCGGDHITLSWWGSAHAERYEIQRSTQKGGPYTKLGTVGPKDTSFIDQNVTPGTTYYYVVVGDGSSVWNGKASAELEVAPKLVAQYNFEGNGNDAVAQKHAVASGSPTYVQGMGSGKAIALDGSNDYLTLPTGIANYEDITIAAWIFWEGERNYERIFDFGGDVTKSMFLTPKAGEVMRFEITTSRGTEGTGRLEAPALKPHRWTHIAVTLCGDIGTLYVDGQPVNTATITLDPLFTQNHCYLGKSQWPDPLFKGRIDDFRIYNYALPASAIRDVFNRLK
jgi:hypothetical protein